jgi:hypothetical protein
MKIKWVVILFGFFLGVILLSLLITRQSQKSVSLVEQEIPQAAQPENRRPAVYSAQARPAAAMPGGGITIIKAPVMERPAESTGVSAIEDKTTNKVLSQKVAANNQPGKDLPDGSVTVGKFPSPKEAKEMNSSGIVLY